MAAMRKNGFIVGRAMNGRVYRNSSELPMAG
jgi:hypothetical protein